ncbi:MAG: hypothetical protein R2784_16340 [Saprospiraceae bacterium]
MKGVQYSTYAFDHPDAANDYVKCHAKPGDGYRCVSNTLIYM